MSLDKQIDGALVRSAAQQVSAIRSAIRGSVDVEHILTAFLNDFPIGSTVTTNQVREWCQTHINVSTRALTDAVREVHAIGYVLGEDAAKARYARAVVSKAGTPFDYATALAVDWSKWKPGNRVAALLTRGKGRFAQLLTRTNATIRDMNATTLNRIGTILADGLSVGAAGDTVAKEFIRAGIKDLLNDPRRAVTIANTEMARASSVASNDSYQEFGVDQVEWIGVDPCDICAENEDASPIPMGSEFPSGDTEPPGHPNCRCAIGPVIEGFVPDKSATIAKGVPSVVEVAQALSRLEILPNPIDTTLDNPEKFVESPWETVAVPTVDPNAWSDAVLEIVNLDELVGTDVVLRRKNVAKHIKSMGASVMPFRSYALVKGNIIIDGHHRLMAWWLLGQSTAPVWRIN